MPVEERSPYRDPWSVPTFLLWLLFLLFGLGLEPLYYALREYAGVTTKIAFINSPVVVQLAMAAYFVRFAQQRAREVRNDAPALDYVVPVLVLFIVAAAAFWWFPYEAALSLGELSNLDRIWTVYVTSAVLLAAFLKTACWVYLLSLVVRYYLLHRTAAFARVFGLAPRDEAAENSVNVVEFGGLSADWGKVPAGEPRKEPAE